jgi:ribosomal protein S18 acetylase RimI-like enzyme
LAVDSRYAGQGVGSHLLLNALRRVFRATQSCIGVKAVVVDALHERAAGFYEKFGFQRFKEGTPGESQERSGNELSRLVMSLMTIREIFPDEGAEPDEIP